MNAVKIRLYILHKNIINISYEIWNEHIPNTRLVRKNRLHLCFKAWNSEFYRKSLCAFRLCTAHIGSFLIFPLPLYELEITTPYWNRIVSANIPNFIFDPSIHWRDSYTGWKKLSVTSESYFRWWNLLFFNIEKCKYFRTLCEQFIFQIKTLNECESRLDNKINILWCSAQETAFINK